MFINFKAYASYGLKKTFGFICLIVILCSCNSGSKVVSSFGKRKYTKGYYSFLHKPVNRDQNKITFYSKHIDDNSNAKGSIENCPIKILHTNEKSILQDTSFIPKTTVILINSHNCCNKINQNRILNGFKIDNKYFMNSSAIGPKITEMKEDETHKKNIGHTALLFTIIGVSLFFTAGLILVLSINSSFPTSALDFLTACLFVGGGLILIGIVLGIISILFHSDPHKSGLISLLIGLAFSLLFIPKH